MPKRSVLSTIRSYRANRTRVNKYPCLSLVTGSSAFLLCWCFAFAMYSLTDARSLYVTYNSKAWPATNGTLISGSLTPACWWRREVSKLEIDYAYTVNGQSHTSRKISFSPNACGSREDAKRVIDGSTGIPRLTVYYDPDTPSSSVLVRGFYGDDRFFFPTMFALKLFVLFSCIRAWRMTKSKKLSSMRKHVRRVQQYRLTQKTLEQKK